MTFSGPFQPKPFYDRGGVGFCCVGVFLIIFDTSKMFTVMNYTVYVFMAYLSRVNAVELRWDPQ